MPFKRAVSRAQHIVTTVSLPEKMHRELAHAAVEERAALTELVRRAIKDWLKQRRKGLKSVL